jgi:RNA recognition motif-containing protein
MATRLYVGNLSYNITEDELRDAFAPFGVSELFIPMNSETALPRGFAFVDVDESQASAAIAAWDGQELCGRPLRVSEARPRDDSPSGGRRPSLPSGGSGRRVAPDDLNSRRDAPG